MTAPLFAAAAFCLVLALHPFVIYPISLGMLKRRAPAPAMPIPLAERPSVALCVSAYNEERVIVAKVEAMLRMAERYGPATVHVYVDGATDRTPELLRPYADRIDLVVSPQRLGKTAGLNALVARSRSDLLAFTDANVVTPDDGLLVLAAAFADPAIGCTTAKLVYENEEETPTSAAGSFYWRLEERLKRIESATVGVIGVDGAFFMMRRAIYEPAPSRLIDDLYVTLIVLARGLHVATIEAVQVRERSAAAWQEEFRRKRRIACQAMNVHRALWPRLRAELSPAMLYAYVSHRLLKWVLPFSLAASALLFLAALTSLAGSRRVMIGLVAAAGLTAVLAALRARFMSFALSAATSLYGVAFGVLQSLFAHETYQVWVPEASIRAPEAAGP